MTKHFGGFTRSKEEFDSAAKNRSGSGWAWLSVTPKGDLETASTANQDTPLSNGHLAILGLDVWEHAYYLKYHNKRPEYITNWWHVVNWKKVQEQFGAIRPSLCAISVGRQTHRSYAKRLASWRDHEQGA